MSQWSFRQCEPCSGMGFRRSGRFPYDFDRCGVCKGIGSLYLEGVTSGIAKGDTAPAPLVGTSIGTTIRTP